MPRHAGQKVNGSYAIVELGRRWGCRILVGGCRERRANGTFEDRGPSRQP
jgi:hypothetical protein